MDAQRRRLHRWAVALVTATFLLIVAGGLVTSRDAGLAVPDWPLSYGTLNPPRWYAVENVRTEHGHRLVAGCVALLTALAAWRAQRLESRRSVRRLALALFGLVLLQALLGGLRVLALSIDLAMVHGWLAQMFLCLAVALAVVTSPHWRPSAEPAPPALNLAALAAVALVIVQLIVGIFIRHAGDAVRPLALATVFHVHLLGAAAVLIAGLLVKTIADRGLGRGYLASRARLLVALIGLQIALGIGTWIVTEATADGRSATLTEAWLPTLHVVTGAAVLAVVVTIALHALAHRRSPGRLSVQVAEAG